MGLTVLRLQASLVFDTANPPDNGAQRNVLSYFHHQKASSALPYPQRYPLFLYFSLVFIHLSVVIPSETSSSPLLKALYSTHIVGDKPILVSHSLSLSISFSVY